MTTTAYLLLGTNLGDREHNLETALGKLELIPGLEVTASSAIYITEPQDMVGEQPHFLNQAVRIDYQYRADELLNELEQIERVMGRTSKGTKEPRIIDLDILLFGDEIMETDRLSIPHRELLNRPFAMIPLLDIEENIIHPVTQTPVKDFLRKQDYKGVILYREHVARQV